MTDTLKRGSLCGLLIMVGALGACGGGDADPEPATAEGEASTMTAEPMSGSEVLNPNFASVEQMASLPGLDMTGAQALVDGRPYMSATDLNARLMQHMDADAAAAVLARLFVPLNLNSASREEILLVPGVGERMAHEFEEYRPYESMARFHREIAKYVDDDEVQRLAQYVFVPADLNNATEEEFLAIPGVGDRMLREFMEYRPYESMDQFRREIGKYVDDAELARLERYVTLSGSR